MNAPDDAWLGMGLLPFLVVGGGAFAVGLAALQLELILVPRVAAVVCAVCGAKILWDGAKSPFFLVMGLIILVGTSFWFLVKEPPDPS